MLIRMGADYVGMGAVFGIQALSLMLKIMSKETTHRG